MPTPSRIMPEERHYLRELTKRQLDYANHPIMAERTALWYRHNALQGERPLIVMEMDTFEGDMLPTPRCTSPAAIQIERNLLRHIVNYEEIGDDKVVPATYTVYWDIDIDEFGIEIPTEHGVDASGRTVGYHWQHPIRNLREHFQRLKPATFSVDREATFTWK